MHTLISTPSAVLLTADGKPFPKEMKIILFLFLQVALLARTYYKEPDFGVLIN
jgi:hypothetical protein